MVEDPKYKNAEEKEKFGCLLIRSGSVRKKKKKKKKEEDDEKKRTVSIYNF